MNEHGLAVVRGKVGGVIHREAARRACAGDSGGRAAIIYNALDNSERDCAPEELGTNSDSAAATFSPREVADRLGISPSTLRTYAAEFSRLLSPEARGQRSAAGVAFRHRRYTGADVSVLDRAKTLLDNGLSYRVALSQLAEDGFVASPGPHPARSTRSRRRRPQSRSHGPAPLRTPPTPVSSPDPNGPASGAPAPTLPVGAVEEAPTISPTVPVRWEQIEALVVRQRRDLTQILSRLDGLAARMARLEARLNQELAERLAAESTGWLARLVRRNR